MFTPEILNNPDLYSNVSSESQDTVLPTWWIIWVVFICLAGLTMIITFCFCDGTSSFKYKVIRFWKRSGIRGGGTTNEDWSIGLTNRNIIDDIYARNPDNQPRHCFGEHSVNKNDPHTHGNHEGISGYGAGTRCSNNHGSRSNDHCMGSSVHKNGICTSNHHSSDSHDHHGDSSTNYSDTLCSKNYDTHSRYHYGDFYVHDSGTRSSNNYDMRSNYYHEGHIRHDFGVYSSNYHSPHSHNNHRSSGYNPGEHTSSHHGRFSGHDSSSPSGYDGGGFSNGRGDSGGCGCDTSW